MRKLNRVILTLYQLLAKLIVKPILNIEYEKALYVINERQIEYLFAMRHLNNLCPSSVLDVGSGKSSWPHIVFSCGYRITAMDNYGGFWVGNAVNRHFKVIDDNILMPKFDKPQQLVTCISVLEHIPEHRTAVKNMINILEPGGHLLLTFPYNEYYYSSNIYEHPDMPKHIKSDFITQVYSRREINQWLEDSSCEIVEQEYYKIFDGELWSMGQRINPPENVTADCLHHLTCLLIRKKG